MGTTDKKIFAVLFFSIFASATGVGLVVPLLPVYAHHLGASGFDIALIFGGFSLTRTILIPIFGKLSDKRGRKHFITVGLLSYAAIGVAFIFSNTVWLLIIIRAVQGIASAMIIPVAQAYIGDITPPGKEGFSMGTFNMSMFIGLSIGPLLGGGINEIFSLQAAFACMAIMGFTAFFLSISLLPPVSSETNVMKGYQPIPWRNIVLDRTILALFIFRGVYATCIGIIWAFLPVYGDIRYHLPSTSIGFLVIIGVSLSGLLHIPMGAVADRLDKRILVICGGIICALGILLIGCAGDFEDLITANVLFGIGGGLSMPSIMAIAVISGNEKKAMGSVMSAITVSHSLGMLCGSLFGGIIMDMASLPHAFTLGALLMLVGVIYFGISLMHHKPGKAENIYFPPAE